ncbi:MULTISPECIES: hypothetical protein [Paraburkholderia]|uniref:Uncharacterized protein n=1 Tax=Paraburkholderia fynbosensis TaxID=1200993 RepID=A0A6J5G8V4_9BURK|nr:MULTISPECIES: hypothetical protein [Paraburkholderia]RKT22044.1 hypothetical protein B0G69_5460 [Paraburkholderia sp. RAU2J]CAB3793844.1 hypothetical protein LMG27177_03538 [Paraburkholderia fynbosensis]
MKKIRSARFFAAVAIVSSATVLQIREGLHAHATSPTNAQATLSLCGATRDGLMPARCESTRGERKLERDIQPQHDAQRQLWV